LGVGLMVGAVAGVVAGAVALNLTDRGTTEALDA
jgi:hypothetical protein